MKMKQRFNIAFFGTPQFAVPALQSMAEAGLEPSLVITAPDAPSGRGQKLTSPPVSTWAHEHDIDTLQPASIDDVFIDELANSEWDLFVVAAYGKILPRRLIELPRRGTLNIHPSLLPKLRGATPIQSAILRDMPDAVGVTIMRLDEEMDHGPIVAQARIELETYADGKVMWPTAGVLTELLATEGGTLLCEAIPAWMNEDIEAQEQDHDNASYCSKFTSDMRKIDLDDDAWENFRRIQALTPNPGTYFMHTGADGTSVRVKIVEARYENGTLVIEHVIPANRREMSFRDFIS